MSGLWGGPPRHQLAGDDFSKHQWQSSKLAHLISEYCHQAANKGFVSQGVQVAAQHALLPVLLGHIAICPVAHACTAAKMHKLQAPLVALMTFNFVVGLSCRGHVLATCMSQAASRQA